MTFSVPVTLVDMRATLREQCQLDANDPRASNTVLNKLINAAMHRFQVGNPNGWPWDFGEVTITLTPGVEAVALPVGIGPGDPTKIRYAILQEPGGAWEYPIERTTRWNQLDRYPRDGETRAPTTFTLLGMSSTTSGVVGMQIRLRPAPDIAYRLVLGMQAPAVDLAADSDPAAAVNDYMLGDWSATLLEYASFLVYRAKGDLAEALLSAKATFDEDVLSLRRTARITVGPGRGMNPLADDREI